MDEFVQIMKIAMKACNQKGPACIGCPFKTIECGCAFRNMQNYKNWERIGQEAMEWNKKHPDPRYPTWKEWQDKEFPNAGATINACHFMDKCPYPELDECEVCHLQQIPEEMAKKLRIEKI